MDSQPIRSGKMKQRDISPYPLRLDPVLKQRVADEARQNRRSVNAEIGVMIEEVLNARAKRQAS